MSAWRRKALQLFPKLKQELNDREYTIYLLYFDLLPTLKDAHRLNDTEALRKIYGFAEWCCLQREKELWNPAGVCFYEHLFDENWLWHEVLPWLSPQVIQQVHSLWQWRLGDGDYHQLKNMLSQCKSARYRENIFHTGELQRL